MSEIKNDLSNSVIFPLGVKAPEQFARYFIGTSYLNMIVPVNSELHIPIGNVTFEPGCRNNWHRHPGDVVEIPRHVKHWHGAAKDSWFVHLAVEADATAGPAEWLDPVTDEEYNKLP